MYAQVEFERPEGYPDGGRGPVGNRYTGLELRSKI